MDYFTIGRGVMLAWPFSSDRFSPPFPLFYALYWHEGLTSPKHMVTVTSELGFAGIIGLILNFRHIRKLKRLSAYNKDDSIQ